LRLPILVEHFVEHRSQVPEMTFFQFLAMHYKTDVAHDSTDMELPFKDCCNSAVTTFFTLPEQKVALAVVPSVHAPVFFSSYSAFIPASALDEIFQPPRA
jgi:hypothetical protein